MVAGAFYTPATGVDDYWDTWISGAVRGWIYTFGPLGFRCCFCWASFFGVV